MCLQCIWRKKDPPDVLVEEFLDSLQGQAVLQCHVHSQDPRRKPDRLEFVIAIPADMTSRLTRAFSLTDSRNLSDTRLTTSTALGESTSTELTMPKCANSLQCSFIWPCVTAVKVDKKTIGIEEFVNMFVKSGSFLGLTTFPCSLEAVSSWQLAHVSTVLLLFVIHQLNGLGPKLDDCM